MKHPILSLSLFLLAAPALAEDTAPAASCKGLQSKAEHKDLQQNIDARQKRLDQWCADGSPFMAQLENMQRKYLACGDLGQQKNGQTLAIKPDQVLPLKDVQQRIIALCRVRRKNQEQMKGLCHDFERAASDTQNFTPAQKQKLEGGQTADLNVLKDKAHELTKRFKALRFESHTAKQDLLNNAKIVDASGVDQQLDQSFKTAMGMIAMQAKAMRAQLSATKLDDRKTIAAGQDESGGALRLRTNADVKKFWRNIQVCESLAGDKGDLANLREMYYRESSRPIAELKKEADGFEKEFSEREKAAIRAEAALAKPANGMGAVAGSDITGTGGKKDVLQDTMAGGGAGDKDAKKAPQSDEDYSRERMKAQAAGARPINQADADPEGWADIHGKTTPKQTGGDAQAMEEAQAKPVPPNQTGGDAQAMEEAQAKPIVKTAPDDMMDPATRGKSAMDAGKDAAADGLANNGKSLSDGAKDMAASGLKNGGAAANAAPMTDEEYSRQRMNAPQTDEEYSRQRMEATKPQIANGAPEDPRQYDAQTLPANRQPANVDGGAPQASTTVTPSVDDMMNQQAVTETNQKKYEEDSISRGNVLAASMNTGEKDIGLYQNDETLKSWGYTHKIGNDIIRGTQVYNIYVKDGVSYAIPAPKDGHIK